MKERRSKRRTTSQVSKVRAASAAAEIIAERGIESLSMRVLAARLGCSVGTLTYHFKSKQELLDQVFNLYIIGNPEFFDNLRYGEGWVDDVMSRLDVLMPLAEDSDARGRVHLAYWAHSLPAQDGDETFIHAYIKGSYRILTTLFEKAQQSGNVAAHHDPSQLGVEFTHLITGTLFCMLHVPLAQRAEQLAALREFLQRLEVVPEVQEAQETQ